MNSDRKQKLMIILLAGMAIAISSFANTARPGRADFSSHEDDTDSGEQVAHVAAGYQIENLMNSATTPDQAQDDSTVLYKSDNAEVTAPHPVNDEKKGWTTTVHASVTSDTTDKTETYDIKITRKNAEQFKEALKKAIKDSIKIAKSNLDKAEQKATEKEERQARIDNCEEKADRKHTKIDDSDVKGKVACLSKSLQGKSGEKRQEIQAALEKYVKTHKDLAIQALMRNPNDPTGRAMLGELQSALTANKINMGQAFNQDMQIIAMDLNSRLVPYQAMQQAAMARMKIENQYAILNDPNNKLSAQQRTQLLAQKNRDLSNVIATQMQADMSQGSLLSSMLQIHPSSDAMVNEFTLASRASFGREMQQLIGQNPSLASQYSNIAASYNSNPMLANSYLNSNLVGSNFNPSAINSNPLFASNMFGPNNISSFDMSQGYWDPYASSNLGNMALGQQSLVLGQNMLPIPTSLTQTANLNQPAKFISR